MRKITLLLMILVVGAVGGLWAAAAGVNGSRDQVVFQETTQMGDRTAAQGLQVNIRTQLRENLFWNTSCVIGEESQADTEYQFSSLRFPEAMKMTGDFKWISAILPPPMKAGIPKKCWR